MRKFVKLGLSLGALVLLLQTTKVSADSGRWVSTASSCSYIEDDGERATGWERIKKKWYYFNYYGIMQTGWQQIGNTWYYFYSSGEMATGWLKQGSSWYYLKGSGAMATGWAQIGGQWYHFNNSGRMSSSTWVGDYYLTASGAMARNTRTPDGYWVDASGRWVRGGSSSNSSTTTPKTSTINGTYKGQYKRDYITMTISGTTGTWTEVENDGERDIKQISIDPANKLIYIGDDVKIYTIKGNQLIINDMDRDPSDRIVLSK